MSATSRDAPVIGIYLSTARRRGGEAIALRMRTGRSSWSPGHLGRSHREGDRRGALTCQAGGFDPAESDGHGSAWTARADPRPRALPGALVVTPPPLRRSALASSLAGILLCAGVMVSSPASAEAPCAERQCDGGPVKATPSPALTSPAASPVPSPTAPTADPSPSTVVVTPPTRTRAPAPSPSSQPSTSPAPTSAPPAPAPAEPAGPETATSPGLLVPGALTVFAEQVQARQALDTAVVAETAARVAVARAASPAERVAAQDRLAVASAVVAGAAERSRAADSLAAGVEPTPPSSAQATPPRRDRRTSVAAAPSRASFEAADRSSGWPYLILVFALALLFPMAWRRASGA